MAFTACRASADLEGSYPPLMHDQVAALQAYARRRGRVWKTRLRAEWMDATADPLLHRLRNTHGPMWLDRLVLASISANSGEENHVGQC